MVPKPITIVGGGLAGLTLGIGLRKMGVPVTICESGHYPRHRVCGEFISGRGQAALERLEILPQIIAAGAKTASTVAFFSGTKGAISWPLPQRAVCLSRFTLDALLAGEFRALGGDLREGERWPGQEFSEGIVRANGRRSQPVEAGWRWFGLKAHFRNVELAADLEMHLLPSGYVGLCRLKDDTVNVCGLFRRRTNETEPVRSWQEQLRGPDDSQLRGRLAQAEVDETSFCSVAGLSLRPRHASTTAECSVGDALTMIPPVTGNGMSMAFESAELAIAPLTAFSRGEVPWERARTAMARACDAAFARRLTCAWWMHRALFQRGTQRAFFGLAKRWDWTWQKLFAITR